MKTYNLLVKNGDYCPCQVPQSEDTRCLPCKQYERTGHCVCGKYPDTYEKMNKEDISAIKIYILAIIIMILILFFGCKFIFHILFSLFK